MNTWRLKVYLHEVNALQVVNEQIRKTQRGFSLAYILTDKDSEEWVEFCMSKSVYMESVNCRLKAAEKTLETLESLGREGQTPTAPMRELRTSHRQRGNKVKVSRGGLRRKERVDGQGATKKRQTVVRQALACGVLFASGIVCGIAWKIAQC